MFYEDFRVGQRVSRPVTSRQAAAFDLLDEPVTALSWHEVEPIGPGEDLCAELVVTRCRRTARGDEGEVTRHITIRDAEGRTAREGSATSLVPARSEGPDPASRAFGTTAWAKALVEGLGTDFADATATWDGTIGLRSGRDEVHLRVYRGRVIDVTHRAPLGATFTFGASELVWTELATGPADDFMRRAMLGQFDVTGNGYEYLRLTKVLALLVTRARELAR